MFTPSKLSSFAGLSLPSIFTSSPKIPIFSIPTKPIKLHLFTQQSSLQSKSPFPSSITFVSQEENINTITIDEEIEQKQEQLESEDTKLFVGGLIPDFDSESLAMLFQKAGTVEIAEIVCNKGTEQSRGYGFVTMSSVEEAEKAKEMFNQFELNGKLLTVNKAAPRKSRPERRPRESEEPGFKVFVGNLPWSVNKARLEQLFSEHGKVVAAHIVYDPKTRRSRGYGFVAMSTETELNDAVAALNGQSIDGREITVDVAGKTPS